MDFGGQRRAAAISRAWHARHARYTLECVTVMPRVYIIDKLVDMNCFSRPALLHSVWCIANYRSKSFEAPCHYKFK